MATFLMLTGLCFFISTPDTASAGESPELRTYSPVTAGVLEKHYRWVTNNGASNIYVLEVDLSNPYVRLDAISGGGKVTQRTSVSGMAANTGAVAAVNADFYNTRAEGAPIGPMVVGSRLAASPSKIQGLFALGVSGDQRAYIEGMTFQGTVKAPNGNSFAIAGLNKTAYWEDPGGAHSHVDKLHLYNDLWGAATRGGDTYTTPTEMLIKDGRVKKIVEGEYIDTPVPEGHYILRGHRDAARFLLENFKVGDRIELEYRINPDRNWQMVLGGHALLLDEGRVLAYARESAGLSGVRARTAAGVSRDGKKMWLVGVEGGSAASVGLSLSNLGRFFEHLGAWRALNLDGGGSTTMVSRPLGMWETKRVFSPEQSTERLVPNALGIYTTAPTGALQGFTLQVGEKTLLVGQTTSIDLGAYDQYYNPLEPGNITLSWQIENGIAEIKQNQLEAKKSGRAEVIAIAGNVSASTQIQVIGFENVATLQTTIKDGDAVARTIRSGDRFPLQVKMRTKEGLSREVPPNLVDWQIHGFSGSVSDQGMLTVDSVGKGDYGFVVARYQDFSAPLVLRLSNDPPKTAPKVNIELTVGSKEMVANGEIQTIDVPPVVQDGRTLVPVRFISEALGAPILWDNQTKNATIIRDRNWIDLWVNNQVMVKNGVAQDLDVPPLIRKGRTLLPLRAVSQALGVEVHWDAETRKIYLF